MSARADGGGAAYAVRRDDQGFAAGIDRDGWTVLHLTPGTTRNEENADRIVATLNGHAYIERAEQSEIERLRGERDEARDSCLGRDVTRDEAVTWRQRLHDAIQAHPAPDPDWPGHNIWRIAVEEMERAKVWHTELTLRRQTHADVCEAAGIEIGLDGGAEIAAVVQRIREERDALRAKEADREVSP